MLYTASAVGDSERCVFISGFRRESLKVSKFMSSGRSEPNGRVDTLYTGFTGICEASFAANDAL